MCERLEGDISLDLKCKMAEGNAGVIRLEKPKEKESFDASLVAALASKAEQCTRRRIPIRWPTYIKSSSRVLASLLGYCILGITRSDDTAVTILNVREVTRLVLHSVDGCAGLPWMDAVQLMSGSRVLQTLPCFDP